MELFVKDDEDNMIQISEIVVVNRDKRTKTHRPIIELKTYKSNGNEERLSQDNLETFILHNARLTPVRI